MNVSPGVFHTYVALLALSGIVMLVVALLPINPSRGARIIGAVLGLAFLGYAFYLQFVFDGGSFELFYYVFAVPFIYIWRVVRMYVDRSRAREAAALAQTRAANAPMQPPAEPAPPAAP